MIVLGQPGIAKSAVLRELVSCIDFENHSETPYFHIQMGSDISPNNIFGAPDIAYFKTHGIIKRQYKGFLPDALIAFCSEFYRISDQVANSGLLTILNEGEFKNGTDTVKTNLRFFMADTNFFPKQEDDLDAEETDMKLQALHDRFLARFYLLPLCDFENKVQMILMDDSSKSQYRIALSDLIEAQESLHHIELDYDIAKQMVLIANTLSEKHHIFISPRRLKMSRNLVRASALFNGRTHCQLADLKALEFTFWQKESDIQLVKDVIYDVQNGPNKDADRYLQIKDSIIEELERNLSNESHLPAFNADPIYLQASKDLMHLLESVKEKYPKEKVYPPIDHCYDLIEGAYKSVTERRKKTAD